MRFDPQIASPFEQMELPVWGETAELRRFVARLLAMLPREKRRTRSTNILSSISLQ
jgi:hypothetical protein